MSPWAQVIVTLAAAFGGGVLGVVISGRHQRRLDSDRLLAQALNDAIAAIVEVARGAGPEAQARYGSATARIALHGSSELVNAFVAFQELATTGTPEGRDRLVAAVQTARVHLGCARVRPEHVALLFFGRPEDGRRLDTN